MGGVEGDNEWSFSFQNNPLWKLKTKIQHSGWLQFILPFLLTILLFIPLAFLEQVIFRTSIVFMPLSILTFSIGLLDLITIKFNIRPTESIPSRKDYLSNIETILERKSCRSFQPRKLTDLHRQELLDTAKVYLQEKKIFNKSIRLEYIDQPIKVWPAVGCQEFLVAIAPKVYSQKAIWDLGRCLQYIVLHGIRMGLGTLWIGPGADHASIIHALGEKRFDPNHDHIICVCAFGYPSWFIPIIVRLMSIVHYIRLPLKQLVFQDNKCQQPLPIEDERVYQMLKPAFEAVRSSPSSFNAQTTRCSAVLIKDPKTNKIILKQIDFYRTIPSKFYATIALGIWLANFEFACDELGLNGHFEVDKSKFAQGHDVTENTSPIYDISWVFHEYLSYH